MKTSERPSNLKQSLILDILDILSVKDFLASRPHLRYGNILPFTL